MDPFSRSVRRDAFLSTLVLLSLALASCAPVPLTPAPPTIAQLPEQTQAPTPLASTPLPSTVSPSSAAMATVAPAVTPSADAAPGAPAAAAAGPTLYEDPSGRFTVPIPANWRVESGEGYVVFRDPEDTIRIFVVVVPGDDAEQAITDAWAVAEPTFSLAQGETAEVPSMPGIDESVAISYDAGDQRMVETMGQRVNDQVYVLMLDGSIDGLARRGAQARTILEGLTIAGTEQVDLTNVMPRAFTPELLGEFEVYIAEAMEQARIPGAAVAIVQNGQVVYLKGFGVREMGRDDPVTPDTLMLIGSTGKTMTTMMMATLVDEQRMQWDTPAIGILPSFALADPDLTQRITMRNLVCACAGVPRRDPELLFNANSLTAQDLVASLRSFQLFGTFGEAWQYSNQMVATGGYLAALAGSNGANDIYSAYLEQMKQRVFDPIGMSHTTFDFEEAIASPDFATPHGQNILFEYSPLPFSFEKTLIPAAPAGGSWSNARDMARYLITELNEGVNPDGVRVVSAENLRVTWEPQVPVKADSSYGLGWFVDRYKGLQLLHHGGNTLGFTSDLAFLPEARLGIVVLTNARASTTFNEAIRFRLFEMAFDQPTEQDAQFKFALESTAKVAEDIRAQLKPSVDPEQIAPYLGSFTNELLGDITLSMDGDRLMLDAGEFALELRPRADEAGQTVYVVYGWALAGRTFEFSRNAGSDGEPTIVLYYAPERYTFTRS